MKYEIAPANAHLLEDLELFVLGTRENRAHFNLSPFGIPVDATHVFNPLRVSTSPFLELLKRLDEVTFGPEGMPMPRWVFFVGAELPGGIVGFGKRAENLTDAARRLFGVRSNYRGIVPYSMFIAIPMFERGVWMGHNLASVGSLLPKENLSGLGSLTKAVALKTYQTTRQVGATQWDTHAISVHIRLGPLELLTAWTPAHGEPWTLTYSVMIDDNALANLGRDPRAQVSYPPPDFWVDSSDHAGMQALQEKIEQGARYCICGRPEPLEHGRQRVPVAKIT